MQGIVSSIRNLFLRGLLIVVPAILTFIVLRFLFETIDGITRPLFERIFERYIPGTGLLATLFVILFAGVMSRFLVGRKFYEAIEELIQRIPLVGFVYGPARQLMESFTNQKAAFSDVVLIEYPRKEMYAVAFATRHVTLTDNGTAVDAIVVFVPTTPTPLSGFTVLVPSAQVRRLEMTVEEAMGFVVSGGISSPEHLHTGQITFGQPRAERA